MSSFSKVTTKLKDRVALVRGLANLGIEAEGHDSPQELVNHWGTGHGTQTAEVIVRATTLRAAKLAGGTVSDIGFRKQRDGLFELAVNDMDRRTFGRAFLDDVQQQHDAELAKRLARRQGYRTIKSTTNTENGDLVLTFEGA